MFNHTAVRELDLDVFGRGTGDLILRNWLCSGNEERLINCRTTDISSCRDVAGGVNRSVAGIYCFGKMMQMILSQHKTNTVPVITLRKYPGSVH